MIADTSAIVALIMREPEYLRIAQALEASPTTSMSAVSLFELKVVMASERMRTFAHRVDEMLLRYRIGVVPFDAEHVTAAEHAYETYGKGNHPAGLNLGDCASYATATIRQESLLYVGKDFAQTDIESTLV